MISRIEITNRFGINELDARLRRVQLRGFPNVRAYEKSDITIQRFTPTRIASEVFTPQPSVYAPELKKVEEIAALFQQQGVDIFRLDGGVDYVAFDEKGEATEWTVVPPVVEVARIRHLEGMGLDFDSFIGPELRAVMREKGYRPNPELGQLNHPEYPNTGAATDVLEICDGSHRIEVARRRIINQHVLVIGNTAPGFPYYAAPKPYRLVHVEQVRDEERLDKTHILTNPGHKTLYRVFPTGGIKSGNIRPTKEKVD